jgi:heme/copper-type cytochrome/quinol oxidase subunit 2
MDITTIETLITSVGFPIVCVIALGWFVYRFYNDYTTQSREREEKLMQFIVEEQCQMQNLVSTNAEFVEVLNGYKKDIEEIKRDVSDIKNEIQGKE